MNLRDYPHADRDCDEWADTVAAADIAAERADRDYDIARDVLDELWREAVAGERALDDFYGYGSPREWLYHLDDDNLVARALALAFTGAEVKGMAEEAWNRASTALLDLIHKSPTARDDLVRRMRRVRPGAFL